MNILVMVSLERMSSSDEIQEGEVTLFTNVCILGTLLRAIALARIQVVDAMLALQQTAAFARYRLLCWRTRSKVEQKEQM